MPTPGATAVRRDRFLLLAVLVVATCGLVYELICATMASYLLGDSVTQFSLVIGVYLSAMGFGSYLSKGIEKALHQRFVDLQLGIAMVGGFSATAMFLGFGHLQSVRPLLFGILTVVGTLVGLEIPLLMRIMRDAGRPALKDLVARVLAFDYLGALAASVLFPLLLLPQLGLVRTSLLFGVLNAAVALWSAAAFRDELARPRRVYARALAALMVLLAGLAAGGAIERFGEGQLFEGQVIFSERTRYQRLTITRTADDFRLYIDGNLQFSSLDERRYHEALVHPALAEASEARRALILGGGDGLAARELLGYQGLTEVHLVDLDPRMTEIFAEHPVLSRINEGALVSPRLSVHSEDAMHFLESEREQGAAGFDVIVVDLPDPNNFSLGKLYTHSFYRLLRGRLALGGTAVIQATSPYLAPRSFWCIVETLRAAGLNPRPYHAHVPSFGDWGFVLASHEPRETPLRLANERPLTFLSDELLPTLFTFPLDQRPPPVEVNRLNDQLLVHYYEEDLAAPVWSRGRG